MVDGVQGRIIVLAEDDSDDSFLFQEAIREITNDVSVAVAEDGEVLMQLLKETNRKPDLIFLDLNMPRKNGLKCLEEIREAETLQSLPVVIFSTSSDGKMVEKAREQGANLYVQKPVSYPDLKKVLGYCLERDWQGDALKPHESFLLKAQ